MLTCEEAIKHLENIEREITALKTALQEGWSEGQTKDLTQVFLEKCSGWEDTRSAEEIITDIYASRTTSDRGANVFGDD